MSRATITALLLALGLAAMGMALGCGRAEDEGTSGEDRRLAAAVARARSASESLGSRLMTALGEQLGSAGPAAAIDVCARIAPAVARELSRDGVEIRRTSLRVRNPDNAPDSWERSWLERLEHSLAAGELPEEVHEVLAVAGGERRLRYLRPIVVGPNCLQCHGAASELSPAVREQIAEAYPNDRATGFSIGDLRGAFSVRVRLEDS